MKPLEDMSLPTLLKKATYYILGDSNPDRGRVLYQDGEALFCKNNVCVHPPSLMRQYCDIVHNPGYMTIICRLDKHTNVPSLHLSWIPNSTLRKHPTTLENVINNKNAAASIEKQTLSLNDKINEKANSISAEKCDVCLEVKAPVDCQDCERICSGGAFISEPHQELGTTYDSHNSDNSYDESLRKDLQCKNNAYDDEINNSMTIIEDKLANVEGLRGINANRLRSCSIDSSSSSSMIDANGGGGPSKNRSMSMTSCHSLTGDNQDFPAWMRSPESLAHQHNLIFPESTTASPIAVRRAHRCRRFSVDLGQMRSLRLFFSDPECASGQLVVASRESQYKILHFHHGGLDRLATILHQWHQVVYSQPDQASENEGTLPYR